MLRGQPEVVKAPGFAARGAPARHARTPTPKAGPSWPGYAIVRPFSFVRPRERVRCDGRRRGCSIETTDGHAEPAENRAESPPHGGDPSRRATSRPPLMTPGSVPSRAEQRQRELEVFAESSRLVAGTLDLSEVLDRLAGIAMMRLEVDLVRIWLLDDRSDDVVLHARTGTTRDVVAQGDRLPVGKGLAGWVVSRAEPLAVVDVLADERARDREWFEAEGIHSF